METNVQRIDPDRAAMRPSAPRARRRSRAFVEELERESEHGAEGEPAPAEREVAPPATDETGTRLDVVG